MTVIEDNSVVLFQGDSVTDCGRDYTNKAHLGCGYSFLVAAEFGLRYPEKKVTFLNRGINGNRVKDLEGRWQEDCLDLTPDYVSILIGINDTWRRYDSNDPTSAEQFYEGYRRLIKRTLEREIRGLILLEPFVLPVQEGQELWREDLDPKIKAVRELAREFKTIYVPLDGLFTAACKKASPSTWAGDGVHPSPAGHGLIANAWMRATTIK